VKPSDKRKIPLHIFHSRNQESGFWNHGKKGAMGFFSGIHGKKGAMGFFSDHRPA
jgi:hypothetical protein